MLNGDMETTVTETAAEEVRKKLASVSKHVAASDNHTV